MMLEDFKKSLEKTQIIKKGSYSYIVHPIMDGIPAVHPKLLKEITKVITEKIQPVLPVDKILTMEAMGIPIATSVSLSLNIPYTIIRKRSYGLPNETRVIQQTGYSTATFYLNGIQPEESIVIVDDVLSTGGTLLSIIRSLQEKQVKIKKVIVVVEKGNIAKEIIQQTGVDIESLVQIDVKKNKVLVREESI